MYTDLGYKQVGPYTDNKPPALLPRIAFWLMCCAIALYLASAIGAADRSVRAPLALVKFAPLSRKPCVALCRSATAAVEAPDGLQKATKRARHAGSSKEKQLHATPPSRVRLSEHAARTGAAA